MPHLISKLLGYKHGKVVTSLPLVDFRHDQKPRRFCPAERTL